MQAVFSDTSRQLLALCLFCLATLPVAAQTGNPHGSQRFKEFRQEAEAFNRLDPFANAYRAGHYNGYLAGVLDALQGRSVCFRKCICELDDIVEQHLADHPEILDRPVVDWLVPLMEKKFPCK